jgi:GNAT superfamily N-acetyltransferase
MKAIVATQTWQRAGVYYVRTQAMVKGFQIPLDKEFDEGDTIDTPYILVLDDIYPVATCRLHLLEDKTAKIERVCVLEEYRGKGVGRILIKAAEQHLDELGVKKIIITSRDVAVGFYEALGYTPDYNQTVKSDVFTIVYTEKKL